MKIALLVAMATLATLVCSCQSFKKTVSHTVSSFTGLRRTVTVYRLDGTPMKSWSGNLMIENDSGVVSFLDSAGKDVKITGGIVIVEQQ